MRHQLLLALLVAVLLAVVVYILVELFDVFWLARQPRPWWWPR